MSKRAQPHGVKMTFNANGTYVQPPAKEWTQPTARGIGNYEVLDRILVCRCGLDLEVISVGFEGRLEVNPSIDYERHENHNRRWMPWPRTDTEKALAVSAALRQGTGTAAAAFTVGQTGNCVIYVDAGTARPDLSVKLFGSADGKNFTKLKTGL